MILVSAPYRPGCDATLAAARVADLAVAAGEDVRWASVGPVGRNVHPFWDQLVRAAHTPLALGLMAVEPKPSRVVHFGYDRARLEATVTASGGRDKAKQILVPCGRAQLTVETIKGFDRIICGNSATYETVAPLLGRSTAKRSRLLSIQWDAGFPPTCRDGPAVAGCTRACVFCDRATVDYSGLSVLHMVDELLGLYPTLNVTLLSSVSWPRDCRKLQSRLGRLWPGRFEHCTASETMLGQVFRGHDWVVFPGVWADFACPAALALSCGAAVLAHDVPPYSETVRTGIHGILVECRVQACSTLAPVAHSAHGAWASSCKEAFSSPTALSRFQSWCRGQGTGWGLEERQQRFNKSWVGLLGLVV